MMLMAEKAREHTRSGIDRALTYFERLCMMITHKTVFLSGFLISIALNAYTSVTLRRVLSKTVLVFVK